MYYDLFTFFQDKLRISTRVILIVFTTLSMIFHIFRDKMTGSEYARYDDLDYMTSAGAGGYSSDSDLGRISGGEETDDASESESYNHQVLNEQFTFTIIVCSLI